MIFHNETTIDVLSRIYNGINECTKVQTQGINFVCTHLENDFHRSCIYHGLIQWDNRGKNIFQTKEDIVATLEYALSGDELSEYKIRLHAVNNDLKEKTLQINDVISSYIREFMELRK